jgi:hypothetical protein
LAWSNDRRFNRFPLAKWGSGTDRCDRAAKYKLALREQKVMPFGDENDQETNNFISAVETTFTRIPAHLTKYSPKGTR